MACRARGAVIGGDPWRQDRGGVARAGPSVQPVRMRQAHDPWRAASGATPGVPPVVRGAGGRVRRLGAVALLARATPVTRRSDPWGRGQRMIRGGGRPIHPVARSPAMACASQAVCGPAPSPPV